MSSLHAHVENGLSHAEALRRLRTFGPNELVPKGRQSALLVWLGRLLGDPMVILLATASGTYWILGDRIDAAITTVALVPIFLVTAVLEQRADRALEELAKLASPKARVRRGGIDTVIAATDLVPGDVMFVQEGDVIAADGQLIEGLQLTFDESAMTGESHPVVKSVDGNDDSCRVLAGTTLLAGRGTVRVTETGERSQYGRIGALMSTMRAARTPIEQSIARVITQVGIGVAFICVAVVLVERGHGESWPLALIAGVSLAMAAVPEELPMVYTLYLALGAWRLAKSNALVRRLSSVETLGATSVICVDKTGTLTFGRLELVDTFPAPGADVRELLESAVLASQREPFDPLEQAIFRRALAQSRLVSRPDRSSSGKPGFTNDEDRNEAFTHDGFGDASQDEPLESAAPVTSHDDQIPGALRRERDDSVHDRSLQDLRLKGDADLLRFRRGDRQRRLGDSKLCDVGLTIDDATECDRGPQFGAESDGQLYRAVLQTRSHRSVRERAERQMKAEGRPADFGPAFFYCD